MSEIDPDKLAAAVAYYDNDCRPAAPQFYELLAAARAHLATLPRWKEVEVVRWGIFGQNGDYWTSSEEEADARKEAAKNPMCVVVRLTGTAKVRA